MTSVPQRLWSRSSGAAIIGPQRTEVSGAAWIGTHTQLGAGCRLEDVVVGPRARIAPDTRLTRCVVWDGVEVPPGDYTDTIFYDGGALSLAGHPAT